MRTDDLLATLQHADSFFPGGGIAFSWGLETLIGDRQVQGADQVAAFVDGQLEHRWAVCERAAVVAAHRAADLTEAVRVDAELEAMTLALELREGSRRAGASLLALHERLGTAGAADYRAAIRAQHAFGHLPVVQGFLWRRVGMSEAAAQAASAHLFCVALLGAALRLGAVGHVHSQLAIGRMRGRIAALIAQPVPALQDIYSCTPATEIAAMRHETQASRLFVN